MWCCMAVQIYVSSCRDLVTQFYYNSEMQNVAMFSFDGVPKKYVQNFNSEVSFFEEKTER